MKHRDRESHVYTGNKIVNAPDPYLFWQFSLKKHYSEGADAPIAPKIDMYRLWLYHFIISCRSNIENKLCRPGHRSYQISTYNDLTKA